VKLPPIFEQNRIVEKLHPILIKIEATRKRLAKVPGILKRFRQSVLSAACSGRLTADWREKQKDLEPASSVLERILRERRLEWEKNQIAEFRARGINPKNQNWKARYKEQISSNSENLPELPETWGWATIDQLAAAEANAITDGPFGSNLKTSHYTSSGPRVIRLQNIGEGVFINESAHISAEHYEALAKHCVNAGDLVVAALGAKLPRACIIPAFVGPAIVKADCIRFKPDQGLSIAHYLNYALNEESGRHRTASVVHGVARPRLNLAEIKAIAVPLPPLAEQHEIVRRVEALFGLADAIEGKVVAATARADRLTQAVLAKAFRGELVPTEAELARREGREYEPATVLLERIREDKARLAKTKPIRRILKKPASK
jgi:type I restriction enzyme S subunit